MSDDVVLKVENLGKNFKIYRNPRARIREWISFNKRSYHKDFWALKDISFDVRKGGFLGIIGPNGAGKSTLLKLITGVLEPSTGKFSTKGRVLSLLELSGGMEGDASGRDNIIRSAQLLGFPDGYVEERMDHIEEFAELGEFFDREMRTYSSGMRIRLAFSMFAFLECDILVLDEILSVGDIFFKQKCYARLEELIKQGVTIILVTHSIALVRQYCQEVIVLNNGEMVYSGEPGDGIKKYFSIRGNQGIKIEASSTFDEDFVTDQDSLPDITGNRLQWPGIEEFKKESLPKKSSTVRAELIQLALYNDDRVQTNSFRQGEVAYLYYAYRIKKDIGVPISAFSLFSVTNLNIHGKNSIQLNANHPRAVNAGDILRFKQGIKLDVSPGNYIFNLQLSAISPKDFEELETLSRLDFKERQATLISIKPAGNIEVVPNKAGGTINLHTGLCNLRGSMNIQLVSNSQE